MTIGINYSTGAISGPLRLSSYAEESSSPAISGNSLTVNLSSSNTFQVALNANITTLTISNPQASPAAHGFTILFTADGTLRSITWPVSVKWPSGTAPTMTSTNGKVDIVVFLTVDGGTTWYGVVAGQNF
jgi:hypothetical protein